MGAWEELARVEVRGQPAPQSRHRQSACMRCEAGHQTRFVRDRFRCHRSTGNKAGICGKEFIAAVGVYQPGQESAVLREWKGSLQLTFTQNRPRGIPLENAVRVDITFCFKRPGRLNRKKDPEGLIDHISKPDRDNIDKPVLDAMKNAGWFTDDCQVSAGVIQKFYHRKGDKPHATVRVMVRGEGA